MAVSGTLVQTVVHMPHRHVLRHAVCTDRFTSSCTIETDSIILSIPNWSELKAQCGSQHETFCTGQKVLSCFAITLFALMNPQSPSQSTSHYHCAMHFHVCLCAGLIYTLSSTYSYSFYTHDVLPLLYMCDGPHGLSILN